MHNDTIKVANKIITADDLAEIFQYMLDDINNNMNIYKQEIANNERYEREYQHWTLYDFTYKFSFSVDFYDNTSVNIDNYNEFINIYNNRLEEIKYMYINYNYSYGIKDGSNLEWISQHIYLTITEKKMDIDVSLSSKDNKMNHVYEFIKNKILSAPERYDHIIKKKVAITNKVSYAFGFIPAAVIATLLVFVPAIKDVYSMTYVLYPILLSFLAFVIGSTIIGSKLSRLYNTLIPDKKYAGYDSSRGKSIYEDDIDSFREKSEIHIGKNVHNLAYRAEIEEIEEKYSKMLPLELMALVGLSIVVVLIGILF